MTADKVIERLKRARALIATPATWCKHWPARDVDGQMCEPDDSRARAFCLIGAVDRAYAPDLNGTHHQVTQALIRTLQGFEVPEVLEACDEDGGPLAAYNDADTTEHRHVLQLLDVTIARCEAQLCLPFEAKP